MSGARLFKKRGRGIDLSGAEVVMMIREVAAAKARIAPHANKTEAFKAVADVLNGNKDFVPHTDSKSVRYRYKFLHKVAGRKHFHDSMKSKVSGKFTEKQVFFSQMREAGVEQKIEKLKFVGSALRERTKKVEGWTEIGRASNGVWYVWSVCWCLRGRLRR